jgi:hypothetical protein
MKNRKIETTGELVQIIEEIVPRKPWMKKSFNKNFSSIKNCGE